MIKILTPYNVKVVRFPDGQPHVVVENLKPGETVDVFWSIRNADELLTLMMLDNAIDNAKAALGNLYIPYLMGARDDRIISPGHCIGLEVVTNALSTLRAEGITILHAHNSYALCRFVEASSKDKRIQHILNKDLVKLYQINNSVLIVPDLGASEKTFYYRALNENLTDVVRCDKSRDLENGNITLKVLNPELCADRDCVIIDDIYDGGGTFEAIAKQIKPKSLTVIVTHSIFSKGYGALEGDKPLIDHVITTDSFKYHDHPRIHVVSALEIMIKEGNYDR